MLTLGLNTAFSTMEAALVQDGEILADRREAMPRGQERRLPGLVAELCAEAGVTLAQLTRIGVVAGPGSFTGLRIGVAYARGLALVTGAKAVGITSLEAAIPPVSKAPPSAASPPSAARRTRPGGCRASRAGRGSPT
jgi:tRNA threonylcarbamoyladenosine biosynthesis protein TsaB